MDTNTVNVVENGEHINKGFDGAPETLNPVEKGPPPPPPTAPQDEKTKRPVKERPQWDNQIEFLMSCIATSVGLGNVWRFPFVAYQNGGGAFLIPYIIILLVIGKPMYYLETVIGQFSNSNCVKVWAMSPAMKGTGYAQAIGAGYVLSYYVSIIALCLYYLAMSFQSTLPWALCQPEWVQDNCVPSGESINISAVGGPSPVSSAELYFTRTVLRQLDGIEDGIGTPLWDLTICLFLSWAIIFVIVARGIKSSGKASYFLALFPYVVLIILLIRKDRTADLHHFVPIGSLAFRSFCILVYKTVIRAILMYECESWTYAPGVTSAYIDSRLASVPIVVRAVTLPGAANGILFFITPEWNKILEVRVWYAAVTQVFFSLSVCSGALIMFASYNGFRQNVYRDSMIITTLDTFTSLISGITIFGVLGNLAYELNYDDVSQVIGTGGTSLAFISYPDAIAKSPFLPQLFSVLFFLMMAVLGIGSGVALLSTLNTVLLDAFPKVPVLYMSLFGCIVGFLVGLVYVTPGGQYILELVDYYGGTFMRLFAAITETIGVFWIYGLENMCLDIEFMLGMKTSIYWRVCWVIVTPVIMITVFIYALVTTEALLYGGVYTYPSEAYLAGNLLQYIGMAMIPIFIGITLWKYRSNSCSETVKKSFLKKETFGPSDPVLFEQWKAFRRDAKYDRELRRKNWFHHALLSLTGGYRRKTVPKL